MESATSISEPADIAFDAACCATHAGFASGKHVMLSESDDGRCIDANAVDHLFDPLFTANVA
jgi:hypothetical protein